MNRPVNFNDPSGHYANPCAGAASGYKCHRGLDKQRSEEQIAKFEAGNCYDRGYCTKKEGLREDLNNFEAPELIGEPIPVSLFGQTRDLTPGEYNALMKDGEIIYRYRLSTGGLIALEARQTAERLFPGQGDNSPGNAFQHAYWSALMAREFGSDFAEEFTTGHEEGSPKENAFMDLHNNAVGRNIWVSNQSYHNYGNSRHLLQEKVLEALYNGDLVVWDGSDIYYSDQCPFCSPP